MHAMGTRGPSPRQLLVLLLLAQGYSLVQLAALFGETPEQVEQLAGDAARALGAADWRAGIAAGRRRNLL